MSECAKIEKLLWEYPANSASERQEISSHLEKCPRCKEAIEDIKAVKESRGEDRRVISNIDPAAFDNAVLAKIRGQRSSRNSKSDDQRFVYRTFASIGLAAAIVVFMIISISDLGTLSAFKPIERVPVEEKGAGYNILEIRLKPDHKFEASRASSNIELAKKSSASKSFSILEKPVTSPSPDSINIEAVYLSDETVPLVSQQMRASIAEVMVDTGMIRAVKIPEAILVTVEKMPRAINVVPPEYPVWGRKRGLSCVVWVKARIDRTGAVTDAQIISASVSGAGFEEAALDAAKKSSYLPAESNGIRIPVWIMYPVKFIYKK